MLTLLKYGVSNMFNQEQIQQLAELIVEAEININNPNEVTDYLCLILEDISGCECLSDSKLAYIQSKVQSVLNSFEQFIKR
jgi:hypothetical protein